jgi:chitin synthase
MLSNLRHFCTVQGNFFISFFVLTNALEDPAIIGGKGIEIFNTILKYSYVGLLLSCFILSLGNRPQGSNKGYTLAFVGYAIFTLYMTVRHNEHGYHKGLTVKRVQFAALFLAIKGVQQVAAAEERGATFGDLFSNTIFRDIVLSLAATIGLYVIASLIHVRGLRLKVVDGR